MINYMKKLSFIALAYVIGQCPMAATEEQPIGLMGEMKENPDLHLSRAAKETAVYDHLSRLLRSQLSGVGTIPRKGIEDIPNPDLDKLLTEMAFVDQATGKTMKSFKKGLLNFSASPRFDVFRSGTEFPISMANFVDFYLIFEEKVQEAANYLGALGVLGSPPENVQIGKEISDGINKNFPNPRQNLLLGLKRGYPYM